MPCCCTTARRCLDWGDALMRRRRSPEAFQQARLALRHRRQDHRPAAHDRPGAGTRRPHRPSPSFVPAYAPLNPRLMDLYDKVADRLALIRTCQDARRIRNGELGRDMDYFGDSPFARRLAHRPADVRGRAGMVRASQPLPLPVPDPEGHRTGRAAPRARQRAAVRLREGRRRSTSPPSTRGRNARCSPSASPSGRTSGATPTGRCRRCSRPRTSARRTCCTTPTCIRRA